MSRFPTLLTLCTVAAACSLPLAASKPAHRALLQDPPVVPDDVISPSGVAVTDTDPEAEDVGYDVVDEDPEVDDGGVEVDAQGADEDDTEDDAEEDPELMDTPGEDDEADDEDEEVDAMAPEMEEDDDGGDDDDEDDAAVAPMPAGPAGTGVPGTYTQYPGKDYIPAAANNGTANLVMIEDIGAGLLVEDAAGCEAACDAEPTCNAASYYLELIEDTGLNCYLKLLGDACMLPGDALDDTNAVFSLKCEDPLAAMAPGVIADSPLPTGGLGAPIGGPDIATTPTGAENDTDTGDLGSTPIETPTDTRDFVGDETTTGDEAVAPSSSAASVYASVAAVAVAGAVALM